MRFETSPPYSYLHTINLDTIFQNASKQKYAGSKEGPPWILNFSRHDLNPYQRNQVAAQFPHHRYAHATTAMVNDTDPLEEGIHAMIASLAPSQDIRWNEQLVMIPPGHSHLAAALMAEIRGRVGMLPTIMIRGQGANGFEIKDVVNLADIRLEALNRRNCLPMPVGDPPLPTASFPHHDYEYFTIVELEELKQTARDKLLHLRKQELELDNKDISFSLSRMINQTRTELKAIDQEIQRRQSMK